MKLEKKNVELEKDLENALSLKNEKEASNFALQNTVYQLEEKIKELENQLSVLVKQNSNNEVCIFIFNSICFLYLKMGFSNLFLTLFLIRHNNKNYVQRYIFDDNTTL